MTNRGGGGLEKGKRKGVRGLAKETQDFKW